MDPVDLDPQFYFANKKRKLEKTDAKFFCIEIAYLGKKQIFTTYAYYANNIRVKVNAVPNIINLVPNNMNQ